MSDHPFPSRDDDRADGGDDDPEGDLTGDPTGGRTHDRRVFGWLVLGLVLLFGGLYVAGYLFTSDRLPRSTTVAGVDIGGKTPRVAENALDRALSSRADEPIVVSAAGKRDSIDPSQVGLTPDVRVSVAQAGSGRSWRPDRMWDFFTGGNEYAAVARVDRGSLNAAIESFAEEVDRPAKEGAVTFRKGQATPTDSTTGAEIDRAEAVASIRAAYLTTDGVVPLRVRNVRPEISQQDVNRAMDEFANPAMTAPVIVELGGEDVILRPEAYSAALSMEAQDGALVPTLDAAVLIRALKPAMKRTAVAPEDATVRLVNGRPKVIAGKKGVTFDAKDLTGKFLDLVVQEGDARSLSVKSEVAKPDFSTADARKLHINEEVSSFTTYYPHADYRNTNLGRAATLMNGTILKPGDTFSLNETLGERTAENGFTEGFIISDGVFKEDFGGGVSQVATTTFNAAFFAGLEDVEHKAHSFYIDRYPVGREATVAWPYVDLKFKDDTPYGVLVQAWIVPSTVSTQGEMHVRLWSTKYWDITTSASGRYNPTPPKTRRLKGDECVPNDGYAGFDIDVFRFFRLAGSDTLDHQETLHTTYTPSDSVVCS